MKRIYEATVESDKETAVMRFMVNQDNVSKAEKAAMRAYHKGSKLYGRARVTSVKEIGQIEG